MENEELDYERDLEIDPDRLASEWLGQASLYMKYAEELEKANLIRDESKLSLDVAKEEVERVRSEVSLEVRQDPGEFGLDKVTDSSVNAAVSSHPKFISEQKSYHKEQAQHLEEKYKAALLAQAVKSFEQRKSALENLVKLHGQNYFAGPIVPANLAEEWEQRKEEQRERQFESHAKTLKKTKKKRSRNG